MRYGSVCSGIEAATAAWHHMGWEPAFFSEIEAFPRAVLQHHYPEVPLHGDFTTIGKNDYGKIDLLVGGTPCQSFSVAGLRGGLDDERGNLALEFCRLAQREQPRWIVWENVPGVLSSSGGRDFGSILGALEDLGYGLAYRVLDAQYFGLAQRRRRVFVVGYLGDWRPAAAVLFERHSMSGHPAPSREARKETARAALSGAEERGGCGGEEPAVKWPADVACTLDTDFDLDGGVIRHEQRGGSAIGFSADVAGALTAKGPTAMGAPEVDDNHYIVQAYDILGVPATQGAKTTDVHVPLRARAPGQSEASTTTVILQQENDQDTAYCVAYPINTQLGLRGPDTSNSTREGIGVGGEDDPAYTLQAGHSHGVAYAIQERAVCENPNAGPDGVGVRSDDCAYTLEARSTPEAVPDTVDTRATQGVSYPVGGNQGGDYVVQAFAQNTRDEVRVIGGDGEIAGALAAQPGMKQTTYIAFSAKDHGGDATEKLSPTLRAGGFTNSHQNGGVMPAVPIGFYANEGTHGAGSNINQSPTLKAHSACSNLAAVCTTSAVRRLTPVECERLQGFPDNFTAIPWKKKGPEQCPDGPRYKALGNSMAVPVMRWIGERIQLVDDLVSLF